MIKTAGVLFYEINKIMMNFYWIIYLKLLFNKRITLFGHLMGVISFLYLVSNVMYYLPFEGRKREGK